jgi:diguanylate cyclase (GGDEF)-like protein
MLTGLYNRRWLNNAFTRFLAQANETGHPLCVMLIDVDHFKNYNDTFGHSAGDQALIVIGNRLRAAMRAYDFAIRFGGEEFLILLPNTPIEEGAKVAERIRKDIEKNVVDWPDGSFLPSVTISIGVVVSYLDSTPKSLIDNADAMLYRAKQDGRNCVRF